MTLTQLLDEIEATIPDRTEDTCIDGTLHGWPYHAHLVIGGPEIQLYRTQEKLDSEQAGDITARWNYDQWEVSV